MSNYLNGFLMLGFLIVLYLAVKKYNNYNYNSKDEDDLTDDIDRFNNVDCEENKDFYLNFDGDFKSPNLPIQYVEFNYNPTPQTLDQFQKEQKYGSNMAIKYPNKYAVSLDDKENITYGGWQDLTKKPDVFQDTKVIYNEELYKPNITHMDGVLNTRDTNTVGKSIQEIYDNNIVDFKNLNERKKQLVDNGEPRQFTKDASSKQKYLVDDDWAYENEKPENGGEILNGFYAFDPTITNTPAVF